MKAYVDKKVCIGCELCPDICPDVFRMDKDGKAVASTDEIPDDALEAARDAEGQCPVEAIKLL